MDIDLYRQRMMGGAASPVSQPANGPPAEVSQPDSSWVVQPDAPHFAADGLPAVSEAWTDYRNHDRHLTRQKLHDQAHRVSVIDPLVPNERVRLTRTDAGRYEACRA